ncbi:dipeptidase PepE [Alteromonas sp. C1M14]|uniref:dipeptidase PepE n=1 Tax=Alteromonas sp. C1M14 TaxID=2841567 RepID=UPI001C09A391|nr:dipeptidase PepE [Alteromonas sp. C1M14]MBU2977453.1 dipeptidase PepE [Alteromonas sp. C1M14]
MSAHVLMLSSSRADDEEYLAHGRPHIFTHLGTIRDILFVPYAGVTISWDEYTQKVRHALPECKITGLHTLSDPVQAIHAAYENKQAVLVGGGNTFNLLATLYQFELMAPLKQAVAKGLPYIGWSAGSNICGTTIRTTNDMPITQPPSFDSLAFVQCQINPHYSNYQPPGFNGETRDQRLAEFTALNPLTPVLGIREGSALLLSDNALSLKGKSGVIFLGEHKKDMHEGDDLSEFLHQ